MEIKKIIQNQPTEENPIVVENYPYGRLRTQMRYWNESIKKKGDKFCSQTKNPKTGLWNKPNRKQTYNAVNVVYEEAETGYIRYFGLRASTSAESYKKFVEMAGNVKFNPLQEEQLKIVRAYIKAYEGVTWEIRKEQFRHKETGEIVTEIPLMQINEYEKVTDEEHDEREKKTQDNINKSVGYHYHTDEGTL